MLSPLLSQISGHALFFKGLSETGSRRSTARKLAALQGLEDRVLLTSFDGSWQWVYTAPVQIPDATPPFSMQVNPDGLSFVECPGVGNIPIKLKIKGDNIKGKGKSGPLKVKLTATGGETDNQTPNDPTDILGKIRFLGGEVPPEVRDFLDFWAQRP